MADLAGLTSLWVVSSFIANVTGQFSSILSLNLNRRHDLTFSVTHPNISPIPIEHWSLGFFSLLSPVKPNSYGGKISK